MSAGTLTLTHNADVITGNGTAFTTDLVAGDFVVTTVGGVTYTLPVKSVDSDTEITIISKYPGPTQQGSAWNAVPRATQNQVTAALVVQSTEALRGLNYDKQNWQAVFSADGNITVFLPDGTSFSGPSWKSIAETLSTLDVDYLNQLAAQINHDAQQVEADKNTVVETASQVSTDAQTASTAATGAQGSAAGAAQSETNAEEYKELARKYALNPEDSPVTGSEYSSFHYSEKSRKSAEEAASHNPVEALVKSLNLSDLADRAAAWLNLRPLGSTPLAGDPVNPYDATTMRWVENYVSGGGGTGPTMNGVQNFGIGMPMLWASRAFVPAWAVLSDGQILNRADWPELWAHAQMHTPVDDADWLADKTKRGNYSNGDGATTFRVPDFNGVQDGSIRGLYGRGDGGGFYVPGTVFENGAPDILARIAFRDLVNSAGAHFLGAGTDANGGAAYPPYFGQYSGNIGSYAAAPDATATRSYTVQEIAASRHNAAYSRSPLEVRGNNFAGVWIIRASGGFTAANTLWSVINSDDVEPPAGTSVVGGYVNSEYKVGSTPTYSATFFMSTAQDASGATVARAALEAKNSKTDKSFRMYLDENGVFTTSDGRITTSGSFKTTRRDGVPGLNIEGGEVVSGVSKNDLQFAAAAPSVSTGTFINVITGRWYDDYYQFGGIRAANTTLQRVQLNVKGGSAVASYMFNPNGTAQATQWQSTSDRRIKSCVETIPDVLDLMRSIRGYSWYYEPHGTQGFGFMADEVEKYFPGAVSGTGLDVEMPDGSTVEDVKAVDTYGIAAALHHEAILAMMDQIAELKAEIKKLKGE